MVKEDLVGQVFWRWTVIEPAEPYKTKEGRPRGVRWFCKCSCGNSSIVSSNALKKGASRSCGCLRTEELQERRRKALGESAFNYVYRLYKDSALRRGYSFHISKDLFKELSSQCCTYCGAPPTTKMGTGKGRTFYGSFVYNGLDRADNTRGYEVDNVIPCCYSCNVSKHTQSKKDFLLRVKAIYENLKLNEVWQFNG